MKKMNLFGGKDELFAKGIGDLEYYPVITFQHRKVCEEVISKGSYVNLNYAGKNSRATEVYSDILGLEDEYPLYTLFSIGISDDIGFPATLEGINQRWDWFLKFNGLHGMDILEFRIPCGEGVLGDVSHVYTGVRALTVEEAIINNSEFVVKEFRREYLSSYYRLDNSDDGRYTYVPDIVTKNSIAFPSFSFKYNDNIDYSDCMGRVPFEDTDMSLREWLVKTSMNPALMYLERMLNHVSLSMDNINKGKFYYKLCNLSISDIYISDLVALLESCKSS